MNGIDCRILAKIGYCPVLQNEAALSGIYNIMPDGTYALEEVHCELIDNLAKPLEERNPKLGDKACEEPAKCPHYSSFSPSMSW